jgi:hypothetical protein
MIERDRGERPTAASDWLVKFLNHDFEQSERDRKIREKVKTLLSEPSLKDRLLSIAGALN